MHNAGSQEVCFSLVDIDHDWRASCKLERLLRPTAQNRHKTLLIAYIAPIAAVAPPLAFVSAFGRTKVIVAR